MITISNSIKIYLCTQTTGMRKNFDGLSELVENYLGEDPFSGSLFVFRNRIGDKLKILYWDTNGYVIWYKLLQEGSFKFPDQKSASGSIVINQAQLSMLLSGLEIPPEKKIEKKHKRFITSDGRFLNGNDIHTPTFR